MERWLGWQLGNAALPGDEGDFTDGGSAASRARGSKNRRSVRKLEKKGTYSKVNICSPIVILRIRHYDLGTAKVHCNIRTAMCMLVNRYVKIRIYFIYYLLGSLRSNIFINFM